MEIISNLYIQSISRFYTFKYTVFKFYLHENLISSVTPCVLNLLLSFWYNYLGYYICETKWTIPLITMRKFASFICTDSIQHSFITIFLWFKMSRLCINDVCRNGMKCRFVICMLNGSFKRVSRFIVKLLTLHATFLDYESSIEKGS